MWNECIVCSRGTDIALGPSILGVHSGGNELGSIFSIKSRYLTEKVDTTSVVPKTKFLRDPGIPKPKIKSMPERIGGHKGFDNFNKVGHVPAGLCTCHLVLQLKQLVVSAPTSLLTLSWLIQRFTKYCLHSASCYAFIDTALCH